MVNKETVKFIQLLNVLAKQSNYGFFEFHSTPIEILDQVFGKGIIYDEKNDNRIVSAFELCEDGTKQVGNYEDTATFNGTNITARVYSFNRNDENSRFGNEYVIEVVMRENTDDGADETLIRIVDGVWSME